MRPAAAARRLAAALRPARPAPRGLCAAAPSPPTSSAATAAPDTLLRAPQRQQPPDARVSSTNTGSATASARDDATGVDLKARAVFDGCWSRLLSRVGTANLQAPRELVFLNGAPGSGKTTCIPFILRSRGLRRSVCVSTLLANDPATQAAIAAGDLVSDTIVVDALLTALFDPAAGAVPSGAVVDGFPRTPLQVDLLVLLHDRLHELHQRYADHPGAAARYPRPSFRVVILFVDEPTSVQRQLQRGVAAIQHRARALDAVAPFSAGEAAHTSLRPTDLSEKIAKHRYDVFRRHYATLLRLKERFPFSLIDGCGSQNDTQAQIARELRYQSSLELSEKAYCGIRQVPLASDLVADARRQLVARLDAAATRQPLMFADVIHTVEEQLLPVLRRAALAGRAVWCTDSGVVHTHPEAADMLIDVLSDRGFAVDHVVRETLVPERVDLKTGVIQHRTDKQHVFTLTFERALLRRAPRLGMDVVPQPEQRLTSPAGGNARAPSLEEMQAPFDIAAPPSVPTRLRGEEPAAPRGDPVWGTPPPSHQDDDLSEVHVQRGV